MIQDLQTMFSGAVSAAGVRSGQSFTDDAISTNVLDRASGLSSGFPTLEDEGLVGGDMWLVVQALTAAAGADAAKTLTISLESDSTADLATSATVHAATTAILGSAITAGATLWRIKLPSGDYERYIGLRYLASAAFTAFQIVAFLTPDVQASKSYPSGFSLDV